MAILSYLLIFVTVVIIAVNRCDAFTETPMSSEYMVCRPVASVFGTLAEAKDDSDKGVMPVLQGPAGAPGAPGRTGLPGPKGEPDYEKVSQIVSDKVRPINSRLYKLEQDIKALKAGAGGGITSSGGYAPSTPSPEEAKNAADCLKRFNSPISDGTMCYSVIGGEGLLWTFESAESNCSKHGGHLADLNSRSVYDKIYDYIDNTYSTTVHAWTGMRYEDNTLKLRNGEEASYAKWSSGYPRKTTTSYYASYKHVYIYIDTSAYIRRLSNTRSSTKRTYAICNFDLNAAPTTTPTTTTKKP